MAHARQLIKQQQQPSPSQSPSSLLHGLAVLSPPPLSPDAEKWKTFWAGISVNELIEETVDEIDENATVESACELLLSRKTSCLVVTSTKAGSSGSTSRCVGLFDFADVNAFLTLAATQHTLTPEELDANPHAKAVVAAAKAGVVPVRLVANLSDKNPLTILGPDFTLVDLLAVFSHGSHRVIIQDNSPGDSESQRRIRGTISDRRTLSWFLEGRAGTYKCNDSDPVAGETSTIIENDLRPLLLSSLLDLSIITSEVVSFPSNAAVLDAMVAMSSQGLSSLPIVDALSNSLISVISVTDVGKIVIPTGSKIFTLPLADFIKLIKYPAGAEDGVDRYPVFAVGAKSTLLYAMKMLLATNAHRIYVTDEGGETKTSGFGVVSIVDVLSCFARLASIETDPRSIQRRRRESSASGSSSGSRSNSMSRVRPSSFLSSSRSNLSSPSVV